MTDQPAQAPEFIYGVERAKIIRNSLSARACASLKPCYVQGMNRRNPTSSFVVTLPLITKGRDQAVMRKRFEAGKRLYNALLAEGLRRLSTMRTDPRWAELATLPKSAAKNEGYKAMRTAFGFTEYALSAFGTQRKNQLWKAHLGAHETQLVAKRVFSALNQYSFGKRGKPRFRGRKRPLRSMEGKSPGSGIRYDRHTGCLTWAGLLMPAMLPPAGKDPYLDQALNNPIKYARVLWRNISGKKRYFVQLILQGNPPATVQSRDGVGGLDIGPSTVAIFSEYGADLQQFCPGVDPCAKTLRRLQRKADRSLRATNPHAFDEKGRWVRGQKITSSNRLKQLRSRIANTEQRLQARRSNEHGQLVNALLQQANTWQIEKLSYKAFQKVFGRSVMKRAPGAFVEHLKRKAESAGGKVIELNTWALKMSQYDHCTDTYTKKPLSQRWHPLGDGTGHVQRDVYSALLAMCTDGKTHNPTRISEVLAAHESALRRTGLWKEQSASVVAVAQPRRQGDRADGASRRVASGHSCSRSNP